MTAGPDTGTAVPERAGHVGLRARLQWRGTRGPLLVHVHGTGVYTPPLGAGTHPHDEGSPLPVDPSPVTPGPGGPFSFSRRRRQPRHAVSPDRGPAPNPTAPFGPGPPLGASGSTHVGGPWKPPAAPAAVPLTSKPLIQYCSHL